MAIQFKERPDSRESTGNPAQITLRYVLTGEDNDLVARTYARAATPWIYHGLYRQTVNLKPFGPGDWYVEVPYGVSQQNEPNTYEWGFNTGGKTKRITNALAHVASFAAAGVTPPDHKGAIGVNGNGDAEGCEVPEPAFNWWERHTLYVANYGWAYSQILKALTGKTNDAPFRGFATGQVLYKGAEGGPSKQDPALAVYTFHFEQSDDVSDQTVGDITGVAKAGWDYAWIQYERTQDEDADLPATRPLAVHVERVIYRGDFSQLGIGS